MIKSEGDGPHQIHGLHAAADSEIEEERQRPPRQSFRIGNCECDHVGRDVHGAKQRIEIPNGSHQQRRKGQAEIDAVQKRAMTVLALTGAERLRNQCVQPNQQSTSKHGEDVDENSAKAHGRDGHCAVWKAAHHHGVHDGHAHPADFGENERQASRSVGPSSARNVL